MGSAAHKQKVEWLGSPTAHAFILKDGVVSAISLCNLPVREVDGDRTGTQCFACSGVIRRGDRATWVDPRPSKKGRK